MPPALLLPLGIMQGTPKPSDSHPQPLICSLIHFPISRGRRGLTISVDAFGLVCTPFGNQPLQHIVRCGCGDTRLRLLLQHPPSSNARGSRFTEVESLFP